MVRAINVIDHPFAHYQLAFASDIDPEALREGLVPDNPHTLADACKRLHEGGLQTDTRAIDPRTSGGSVADAVIREA